MAIIVEDGTKMDTESPLPNSYVSVEEADNYWADRNDTVWVDDTTDEDKEKALLAAESYMAQKYRMRWKGSRVRGFQPLDWPRRGVSVPDFYDPFFRESNVPLAFQDTLFIPENSVPREVKTAQILLARAVIDSSGVASVTLQPSLGRVTKREKVGFLEVEYMDTAQAEDGGRIKTIYWDAEQMIVPYLRPSWKNTGNLVRS